MKKTILSALQSIPVAKLSREEWIKIGMALKYEGFDVSVWDGWSQDDNRYHEGECQKKWDSFHGTDTPVTVGTIIMIAKTYGWTPVDVDNTYGWDDTIEYEETDDQADKVDFSKMTRVEQLKTLLTTLYNEDEKVAYTTEVWMGDDGKYVPASSCYDRTAGELIKSLDQYSDDITYTIGDFKDEAGAWIHFNPVDGNGVKKENVTRFSYTLLECDTIPKDEQIRLFEESKIPIEVMIDSAGKSIHALVKVDANDAKEYNERVRFLYDYCSSHDIPIDKQNKNANRKCRMPGVTRNGKLQAIVAMHIGMSSWDEWVQIVNESVNTSDGNTTCEDDTPADGFPSIEPLSMYVSPPALPQELIGGILRKGHKMLISGSSKAGKSLLLMELCIAIAEGLSWLGFPCAQGKILYVNLEIDKRSCIRRFFDIYNALGIPMDNRASIVMWNLRGHAIPLDQLVPYLIDRIQDKGFDAVIIDPIYKVITGDENSATAMAEFTNNFDRICTETGCSVIYCHHHSKGAQGGKRAMDRASGSGVFARDPDAQLDVIELQLSDEIKAQLDNDNVTAWRLESSLREFPNIVPVNFWFKYPLHPVDDEGILDDMAPSGSAQAGRIKNGKSKTSDEAAEEFRLAYSQCSMDDTVTIKDLAAYLGLADKTIYERIKKMNGEYYLKNGTVFRASG